MRQHTISGRPCLETTAIYDQEKDQVIIHSPTLTSTKWSPASMGKTATTAVGVAFVGLAAGVLFAIAVVAGIAEGAAVGWVPGILKVKLGVD